MNDDATVDAPIGSGMYPPGFEILGTVGSGAFGTVYEARDVDLDRVVALKVLTAPGNEVVRERFVREMRTLAALSGHPNVAALNTAGRSPDGTPWFTMDLYRAGSTRQLIDRNGPMPWPEVAVLGTKIAGALDSAHEKGIIHRDVKPSNILIDDYGEPRLADFGVARLLEHGDLTATGSVTGTLVHLAPELLAGSPATPASDTYALASTLHELLTGTAPFGGSKDEALMATISRISTTAPPDLRDAGVPVSLAATIATALAKDPSARPPSAAAFGAALEAAGRGEEPSTLPHDANTTTKTAPVAVTPTEPAAAAPTTGPSLPSATDPDVIEPLDSSSRSDLTATARRGNRGRWIAVGVIVSLLTVVVLVGAMRARTGGIDGAGNQPSNQPSRQPTAGPTLLEPVSTASARDGSVYISDRAAHRVVRVAPDGATSTVVGRGADADDGDGGPAATAGLTSPGAIAFDRAGRLVLMSGGRLRRVLDDGTIVAVDLAVPRDVYLDGRLGFAPNGDVCTTIDRRLWCGPEGGALAPVELTGLPDGFRVDGFTFAGDDVVMTSADTATVARGRLGGPYTTIAGGGALTDGSPATAAALVGPSGVTVEPDGDVVVAELGANRIRRIRASDGRIETVAGKPADFSEGYVDASDPLAARFNRAADVVAGPDGQLLVVDQANRRIRRIAATGAVSTVA